MKHRHLEQRIVSLRLSARLQYAHCGGPKEAVEASARSLSWIGVSLFGDGGRRRLTMLINDRGGIGGAPKLGEDGRQEFVVADGYA